MDLELVAYDPNWPAAFEAEAARLGAARGLKGACCHSATTTRTRAKTPFVERIVADALREP